jgi:signal transduction histidine kinase
VTPPDAGARPASKKDGKDDARTVELIATVSHEIRSPLTTIKGFTKTMLDRWDRLSDETKLEMLQAINQDADRVTRILTELLDVSRLEAGRLTVHVRPVAVVELARELVAVMGDRSADHSLVLLEGDEECEVMADPDKLRQVLTNLIENAQKYSSPGAITLDCVHKGETLVMRVNDQGPGVPPDLAGRIFEKFARRDMPGAPTGTGLGLYISRGLVEAQGGEIGAEFEDNRTTFWVKLPVARQS